MNEQESPNHELEPNREEIVLLIDKTQQYCRKRGMMFGFAGGQTDCHYQPSVLAATSFEKVQGAYKAFAEVVRSLTEKGDIMPSRWKETNWNGRTVYTDTESEFITWGFIDLGFKAATQGDIEKVKIFLNGLKVFADVIGEKGS